MNKNKDKYIETVIPKAIDLPNKPKEERDTDIESMAELSQAESKHWAHLQAKTDLAAEKILTESALSGSLEASCEPEKEAEPVSLGPSISGAIESFVQKNKGRELSDKQVMYKLHKEVSDQVADDIMFPSPTDITQAIPETVIPNYIVEK
jgi:hypothetical protein